MVMIVGGSPTVSSAIPTGSSPGPLPRRIRALIVDDSARFRLELRSLLELEEIDVIGEAGNGWEALTLNETLNPDVILMDQNMPALSGIDATRRIKQTRPDRRVLFMAAEEAWRQEALKAGAEGYFVKGEGFDQLVRAILTPGLAGALQYQEQGMKHRRAMLRRVGVTLAGMAVFALAMIVFPVPSEWFPGIALLFASFSFVLYLFGGE